MHQYQQPDGDARGGALGAKAVEKGLKVKPYVKTSLSPGSRVVSDYFAKLGLDKDLDQLGFQTTGYGCMTCIGNSGPLPQRVAEAVGQGNLVAVAVLSGNRNFEGRINPSVKANYLASPPLVVAYALAGTTQLDLTTEPLGEGRDGQPVYFAIFGPATRKSALRWPRQCSRRCSAGATATCSPPTPSGMPLRWATASCFLGTK